MSDTPTVLTVYQRLVLKLLTCILRRLGPATFGDAAILAEGDQLTENLDDLPSP